MDREDIYKILFGDNYDTFSLEDLHKKEPKKLAVDIEALRQQYNRTQVPDRQFYPSSKPNRLNDLQEVWDSRKGTNAEDEYRYFSPRTSVAVQSLPSGIMGAIVPEKPTRVMLSPHYLANRNTNTMLDTLLHEATHTDQYETDKAKKRRVAGLFGEIAPFDLLEHKDKLTNMPNRDKYFSSGNWDSGILETEANLRASLGKQPKGTSSNQHFADLLTLLEKAGGVTYTPSGATNMNQQTRLKDREAILKAMEMTLFPRERWIEPAPEKKWYDPILNLFK